MTYNSADLYEQATQAGICYLPSDKVFYLEFPYRVELKPKFKGLGGLTKRRSVHIDITNVNKARQKLAEFNEKMEKILLNVEHRDEIKQFVENMTNSEYKTRMGGENSLFYFKNPQPVLKIIDQYRKDIESVTGPISNTHVDHMEKQNLIMRDKLFFNKYRYALEFKFCKEFYDIAKQMRLALEDRDPETWSASNLDRCLSFYMDEIETNKLFHNSISGYTGLLARRHTTERMPVRLYLNDGNDYVYFKMMAGEYLLSSREVCLFDELT